MSQENVEVVRRALEAGFRHPRDWETVSLLVAPNHVFVPLLARVEGASAKGVQGFRDWIARMDETGEWHIEFDELRAAPDGRVLVIARFVLRAERSGVPIDQPTVAVATLSGGKIVRTEVFPSLEEALEAAGLSA